jgi:tetratricopeptide (TPR) repeat protein
MRIRSLVLLLPIVLLSTFVSSQRPGRPSNASSDPTATPSMMKNNTEIQVRVMGDDERPVNDILRVQLISAAGSPIAETFTNKEGNAEFRNQQFGMYQIRVQGSNIEEAVTGRFQVVTGETVHMEWVHVRPKDPNQAVGGKPQGQISASEMAVPDKARKEFDKGLEEFNKNNFKEADKHLEKAVEIYPKYARAWDVIGVIKAKSGDHAGAKESWQKAIDADDRNASAYFHLARVSIMNQQPGEAQKLVEKGLTAAPGEPEGLYLLTASEAMQGKWDEALANARKVHKGEHKQYADVHMIAAQGLAAQNQPKQAIEEYEVYLKEYPDSPRAAQVRQNMAQLQAKVQ